MGQPEVPLEREPQPGDTHDGPSSHPQSLQKVIAIHPPTPKLPSQCANLRTFLPKGKFLCCEGHVLPAHSAPVATLIPPEPAHTRQRDAEETLLLESTLVLQIQVNLTFHTTINGLTVFNVLSQLIPD